MVVGVGDFGIQRIAVIVLGRNQRIHRLALRQRHGAGIAQRDQAVCRQANRAAVVVPGKLRMTRLHALFDGVHARRVDFEVGGGEYIQRGSQCD